MSGCGYPHAKSEGRSWRPSRRRWRGSEVYASGIDGAAAQDRVERGILRRVREGVVEGVERAVARRGEVDELAGALVADLDGDAVGQAAGCDSDLATRIAAAFARPSTTATNGT